jgi:hypothetical protein
MHSSQGCCHAWLSTNWQAASTMQATHTSTDKLACKRCKQSCLVCAARKHLSSTSKHYNLQAHAEPSSTTCKPTRRHTHMRPVDDVRSTTTHQPEACSAPSMLAFPRQLPNQLLTLYSALRTINLQHDLLGACAADHTVAATPHLHSHKITCSRHCVEQPRCSWC